MENYRKSSHCTYDIKYHVVWITKYRKAVITGKIAERTRELIRGVCKNNEVEILAIINKHFQAIAFHKRVRDVSIILENNALNTFIFIGIYDLKVKIILKKHRLKSCTFE